MRGGRIQCWAMAHESDAGRTTTKTLVVMVQKPWYVKKTNTQFRPSKKPSPCLLDRKKTFVHKEVESSSVKKIGVL
jgi:hypothetical protein